MYEFDSRRLTMADCYGRRFERPGVYAYDVRTAGGAAPSSAYPFTVEVQDARSGKVLQHDLAIRNDGERLTVTPTNVTVGVGDFVLWCSREAHLPFVIAGEASGFGNDPLPGHSRYSHAFTLPGDYEWADANGSGLHGIVRVADPRIACEEDRRQWIRRRRNAVLVTIRGKRAEPPQVAIETGQRVYFAVLSSSPGVTVTDVRLLAAAVSRAATRM